MSTKACVQCETTLTPDELEYPLTDDEGNPLCDSCWREKYEGECQRCGENVAKDELTATPGECIAVWEEAPGLGEDLSPGYYRVIDWPIFADGIIEGYFYNSNLFRITDLDEAGLSAANEAGSAAGPLCYKCQAQIEYPVFLRTLALIGHESTLRRE